MCPVWQRQSTTSCRKTGVLSFIHDQQYNQTDRILLSSSSSLFYYDRPGWQSEFWNCNHLFLLHFAFVYMGFAVVSVWECVEKCQIILQENVCKLQCSKFSLKLLSVGREHISAIASSQRLRLPFVINLYNSNRIVNQ